MFFQDAIRDTFWNIPHWAEIAQYLIALLTAIVFLYGIIRHILRWRKGRPEKRPGNFFKRIWSLVVQVLGQRRTLDEKYPGLMHFAIFWGMLVLAVGTALATNPFPIFIPCHRAIAADGSLGGYQGGIAMKRALLAFEGVEVDSADRIAAPRLWY